MADRNCQRDDHSVKKIDSAPQPLFNNQFPYLNLARFQRPIAWNSLKTRLIITITLPVVLLMVIAGYVTYWISQDFIARALERSTRLQVMAIKHEIESFLNERKKTLLFLANQDINETTAPLFLAQLRATHGVDYRSILFLSANDANHLMTCAKAGHTAILPPTAIQSMSPDPRIFMESLSGLSPGEVWISYVTDSVLPCTDLSGGLPRVADHLIYMGTPSRSGYLLIAFNVKALRNILSVYNSTRSPLHAFNRTPEIRYSYLFDADGWILFQSEDPEQPDAELATFLARTGFSGTLGRPGIPGAFRPASKHGRFWQMVTAVREGQYAAVRLDTNGSQTSEKEAFLAYAPIRFSPGGEASAFIYAGIGYMDVSRLTTAAGYKHLDAMFLIILFTAAVMVITIFILGTLLTRPILSLACQVRNLDLTGRLEPLAQPYRGTEVIALRDAINHMIATVNRQVEEIRQRDVTIHTAAQRAPIALKTVMPAATPEELSQVPGIVGFGTKLDKLRGEILKAARVDVDVLIQGETGTGKQLAAEAIHRLSDRAPQPLISINCGALDEQLLLDTLFGHVRGAFTEARTDRKGAFLQASGGTLFLDEIQSASPKVQQSLLRAIAMRRIRPLGSDGEIEVNVRLIAAANVDLRKLIEKEMFREDLYFRLMVIPIHTPPLRDIAQNIPLLAGHYLQQHRFQTNRGELAFSKGALEKLCNYRWPGNIRELQHCIMRAVVMSESAVLQADDVVLGADGDSDGCIPAQTGAALAEYLPQPVSRPGDLSQNDAATAAATQPPETALPPGLNNRQRRAWPKILEHGGLRRQEYPPWCGESVSTRTAIYDLQDLVDKGLLRRTGSGRSVRYELI
ncbi:MAG: sigma 54-interacting transcriptional regulator [Pseudomonadota bacterium]